jgi:hypothetical protein
MPPKKLQPTAAITPLLIESRIHLIRGVRVMLDFHLAEFYEVETKVLNQAVERNKDRFPSDFSFVLTDHEVVDLRSQIVTSNSGRGGRRYRPRVFTEHGVAMLSSVLRSEVAVRVNIDIIRSFIRVRQLFATPGELISQIQKLSETVQLHDTQIKAIMDILQKMMEPPPEPPANRGRFGFPLPKPIEDRS